MSDAQNYCAAQGADGSCYQYSITMSEARQKPADNAANNRAEGEAGERLPQRESSKKQPTGKWAAPGAEHSPQRCSNRKKRKLS